MYQVLDIMYAKDIVFWSCPICMCKMEEQSACLTRTSEESRLVCEKCYDSFPLSTNYLKYRLSMKVCDITTRQISQLTVFGKSLELIVGCEPHQYKQLLESHEDMFPANKVHNFLLQSLLGKHISLVTTKRTGMNAPLPFIQGHSLLVAEIDTEETLLYKMSKLTDCDKTSDSVHTPKEKAHMTTHNFVVSNEVTTCNDDSTEVKVCRELQQSRKLTEECHTEDTWHESLLREFNESLVIDEGNNYGPPNLAIKRVRDTGSLNNTPSAPVRTKARIRIDKSRLLGTTFSDSIFSPLSLPDAFRTPLSATTFNTDINTPSRINRLNTVVATPLCMKETDTVVNTPRRTPNVLDVTFNELVNGDVFPSTSTPFIPDHTKRGSVDPSRDLFTDSDDPSDASIK